MSFPAGMFPCGLPNTDFSEMSNLCPVVPPYTDWPLCLLWRTGGHQDQRTTYLMWLAKGCVCVNCSRSLRSSHQWAISSLAINGHIEINNMFMSSLIPLQLRFTKSLTLNLLISVEIRENSHSGRGGAGILLSKNKFYTFYLPLGTSPSDSKFSFCVTATFTSHFQTTTSFVCNLYFIPLFV